MKCLLLCLIAAISWTLPLTLLGSSQKFLPQYSEVGVGLLNQHVRRVQVDEQGSLNFIRPKLYLMGALTWTLPAQFHLSSELHLGLPHSGRDENIKRWQYALAFPLHYQWESLRLRFGPGLSFLRLWGPGGVQSLDNGLTTTDFFMPEEAQTSLNTYWLAGAEYFIRPEWSARLDLQVFNLFDSMSRSLSQTISIHYHFQFESRSKD